jgi:transposase InsO family protein
VRQLAASGIPVTVSLETLGLSPSPYYRWLEQPVTESELVEAYLANAIFDAHHDDPEFGYRFLTDEIRAAGLSAAERTVWRICSDNGWWCVFGKPKSRKRAKVAAPAHDDLVRRDFTAPGPNRVWLTDITEHRTISDGKLYLCAIKDVWSNRIVGYSISNRMTSQIAVDALNSAVARRRGQGDDLEVVAGCTLHSDRGGQFRARKLQQALFRHRMVGSMGQVGSAGDNAAMESFFALLQKNVLNRRRWETHEELRIAIVAWIERTYHRRRRQDRLGRLTPIEFELIMTKTADQAA